MRGRAVTRSAKPAAHPPLYDVPPPVRGDCGRSERGRSVGAAARTPRGVIHHLLTMVGLGVASRSPRWRARFVDWFFFFAPSPLAHPHAHSAFARRYSFAHLWALSPLLCASSTSCPPCGANQRG